MTAVAKVLLEKGASPLIQNKYGTYPLHFATRRGNVELCQLILDKPGIHINSLVDKGGVSEFISCAVVYILLLLVVLR